MALNIAVHKTILFQILKDLYDETSIAPFLGFKGGTAALMFYGLDRFSVDLDFDLLNESNEYGAKDNPDQPGSYLIDDPELPFYEPMFIEDHVSILGFNYALLSNLLIQAIIDHQELVPNEALVCWTQEQDLIMEKTVGEFRSETNERGRL